MKLRELWKLSGTVYKEISFQSIFYLRAGSSLPQRSKADIKRLVGNARTSTLVSKLLTTFFIALLGVTVFIPMTSLPLSATPRSPKEVTLMGSVSAFMAIVLFLIVFLGLQVSTAFVSSKIADFLSSLPLSKREVSNMIFLCFLRMFDIPLATAAAVFLAAYFYVGGSVLGGTISLVAILTSEIFALALTIGLARFFYSRVAAGGGRSRWQTLTRLLFMAVWILPTVGAYIVMNFAGNIVQSFASLTFSSISHVLVLIYPFSYGFLVSYATFVHVTDYGMLGLSAASSIVYALLAILCLRWTTRTVRTIGAGGVVAKVRGTVKDTLIRPQIPWLGIIRKDLRIASRAPSFAILFLLPAMQTVIIALSFSSFSSMGLNVALGTLTGTSLITLMLPPTLLSMEGLASSYTRSLPLNKRTLILAKTLVAVTTYLISLVALFLVGAYLNRDFSPMLAYAAIHALAVASAIMLELVLMVRKFWKEGFAVGNIYSRLTSYILIIIPGFIVVLLPIFVTFTAFLYAADIALPLFLAMASSEFVVMSVIVATRR